jgi:glyoxylase-like metal-dependent hydrolase (beta-lactamase superfamily II)
MAEQDLRDLGILRIPTPIPFREAGGPANVYAIEDASGGIALFDTGFGSPEANAEIEKVLGLAGHRLAEITRVILSHGHIDHFGGARTILEKATRPVPVLAHPADIPKLTQADSHRGALANTYVPFLANHGMPPTILAELARGMAARGGSERRLAEVLPLLPGESLSFQKFEAEVLHMPGHTPGMLCLWIPERRILLSADHLLEKVSPNPLMDLSAGPQWHPLQSYLESCRRTHALDVALVLPGHASPFGGHRRVIDGLVDFYERRQSKIRTILSDGPRTAYSVMCTLFPSAVTENIFLTFSEALANLEVLESQGAVIRQRNQVITFHLVH